MALAAAASQLSASQGEAAAQLSTAQARVAASSALSVFQGGVDRARGTLQQLAGEAQLRTGLLGEQANGATAEDAAVSDGSHCEGCGCKFGILRRRHTCGSCDRFLCAACMGGNPLTALLGVSCLCTSQCPRCVVQGVQFGEFECYRAAMETGVSVTITLPPTPQRSSVGGLFSVVGGGAGQIRRVHAWLSLGTSRSSNDDSGALRWASLEQRNGQPVEEGQIRFGDLIASRNTGAAIEISIRGHVEPLALEFATSAERQAWTRYIELGMEAVHANIVVRRLYFASDQMDRLSFNRVLIPESARAALQEARASHRQAEMETRRARNEERKKQLQENLGMRFTAEAMVARNEKSKKSPMVRP